MILDELQTQRATLCDLLIGRMLRARAYAALEDAFYFATVEGLPAAVVDKVLNRAVHWELMAVRAETGCILWGGRLNRCGRPEDV
jgi:hypothetical protein